MLPNPGPRPGVRDALARLHTLVLQDAILQEGLGAVEDVPAFIEAAVEAARSRDVGLDADDLIALLRRDPLGLDRLARPALIDGFTPTAGWLPTELSWDGVQHTVAWAWFGRRRLVEPFFEGSLRSVLQQPFNRLFRFRTPLAELAAWPASLPTLRPDGFIFHMSRCGSTLVAQMLAGLDAHVVVSEAPPIDAVVQLDRMAAQPGDEAHAALLRAMVGALGQVRNAGESRYFVKLDSWHALALPLFRKAFPDVPWVFLYRDPVEVLVSQARQRGIQMVPDYVPPGFYGLDLPDGVPDEDYWARVLAVVCQAALDGYAEGGGLLVNYAQLPAALHTAILPHFGITATAAERQAMDQAARRDAKAPQFAFAPDSGRKRQAATAAISAASDRHLAEIYHRLETLRLGD
ncbi:hypothetical protein PMI01_04105 [Caulobacter sp. AP07]|nr:hypothetical protein PMI01_04105 [Caulobacter sp. AP07]